MTAKGKIGVWSLAICVLLTAFSAFAAPAGAAVGQLETWGSFGFGQKQFAEPSMFGVDPGDGSIYVGDVTEDTSSYRIQKFSSSGVFQASVTIPRYTDSPTNSKRVNLWGVAVDPVLHRFYLLEGSRERETTGEIVAKKILVFSTVPKEGKLVAPEGGPSTLPVPTGTNFVEGLFKPKAIEVDPSNHDLVIMAENKSAPKRTLFQRVGSTGVVGARFSDSANLLRPTNENAVSFAVGPGGTVYTMTGTAREGGGTRTRAWAIPPAFTSVAEVPGFADAITNEASPFGMPTSGDGAPPTNATGGPELAISPDGDTLYWKQAVELSDKPTPAGNILVRGFSLSGLATTAVYGGGTAEKCRIETTGAQLATVGERVVVFDSGPLIEAEEPKKPAYGDKVITFGPGGSECPVPTAKFKANGSEGNVSVNKGDTVSFDASGSELASGPAKTAGFRRELIWKFGDGTEKVVTGTGGGEAPATVTHQYTTSGTFKATLEIRLENPTYGNPATVEHGVSVAAGPEFQLTVTKAGSGSGTVTSSPAGIDCGPTCQAGFAQGALVKLSAVAAADSEPVAWSGCGAVNGAGECEVTMSAAKNVTATFVRKTPPLAVTLAGSGSGSVASAPAGISCGADCNQAYEYGTVVKLTGTPAGGSKAVVWSGCDTVNGSNECEVTMTAAKNVTASFSPAGLNSLIVAPAGSGSGTLTSAPAGIACGTECAHDFAEGTLVKLTGTPDAGSLAVVWDGCDAVNGSNQCEVTMSTAKNVTATFEREPHLLKVTENGSGSGAVTSAPAGIDCGATCQATFVDGTLVTLTAVPDPGSKAVVWQGCASNPSPAECTVTVDAAKEVKATFDLVPQRQLTVTAAGNGSGTLTSFPAGISCGASCQQGFAEGTLVKLTGSPDTGSEAVTWSGCDAVNGANECEVTMSAAKNVTATFVVQQLLLTVNKNGSGTGTVTSAPGGISCGLDCAEEYPFATEVTLTAVSGAETGPVSWGGCSSEPSPGKCSVAMSAAKSVTATFAPQQGRLLVAKTGSGSGYVASSPARIGCGGTCQGNFDLGSVVTLAGVAGAGTREVAWTGCERVTAANRCEVTIGPETRVSAGFAPIATGSDGASQPPAEAPDLPDAKKPKQSARQKAVAKCRKKFKPGKARSRCVHKAKRANGGRR